ncbi:MAG TPA: bifunctional UDP-N-acetylglucosamine diphosphorylase/glucosamine-1-phosphate N-acetyltransferase GlmU [Micromonosporaceae bacterium]|jgi:bifunctional UDP-N-acetylglucosamine pyrophosphorylase/glucosamine-1-phosphate N-acetyltransferase|nr:bifunctional UDP-N-acetylglucosamine diphosphorylase/glucosamine-1-phosphate N-acetyltransferase GlmU [Micromonosporaceae bacterium]
MSEARTVIVLAAGEGKRMRSSLPKVLHPLLGRTLLGHVLHAAEPLGAKRSIVVVGHGADQVTAHLAQVAPDADAVLQADQRGTGHAVRTALEAATDVTGTVIVINGDMPMLRPETLCAMVDGHERDHAAGTVLTAKVPDPYGLGRIVRDADGRVTAIVEQRDATPEQRAINEINVGVFAFEAPALRAALRRLTASNDQGEEYLTDILGVLAAQGQPVGAHVTDDAEEGLGANDRAQLAVLAARLRDRINTDLMRSGVTMLDPATTWIDVTVAVEPDVTIAPNTQLHGTTSIATGARVGPDTTLTNVSIGAGANVVRTHGSDSSIGPGASVGPFAYLRPGTELAESAKIGTFVETKNSSIGAGSKVPHLSYVGDATIGRDANIGAATIFVNYDGVHKHRTTVEDGAFIGCDTALIAPVTVHAGAYTAAGSAISEDVPAGSLGISRAPQRNVEGWVERKRPGTKSAKAAAAAAERDAHRSDDTETDDMEDKSDTDHEGQRHPEAHAT